MLLGGGRILIDGEVMALTRNAANVIEALVELRAAPKDELIRRSGVDDAPRVLRRIREKFPVLKPYLTMPGGPGKGGYRTTIVDGRATERG
jgi:hypothetical protein